MKSPDSALEMAQLVAELRQGRDEQVTFDNVVEAAVEIVPDAESASLTVRLGRQDFETMASTSSVAEQADHAQYECDEGPCVEAATGADWLRSCDVERDVRWPTWGPRAGSLGVVSLLSVPLSTDGRRVGALNLYSSHPGRFADRDDVDLALVFAVHAANAIAAAQLVSGLEIAVSARHLIGAAQGMLIERYGLTLHQAFSLLQRLSSHENTKISVLARQLVETGHLPTLGAEDRSD